MPVALLTSQQPRRPIPAMAYSRVCISQLPAALAVSVRWSRRSAYQGWMPARFMVFARTSCQDNDLAEPCLIVDTGMKRRSHLVPIVAYVVQIANQKNTTLVLQNARQGAAAHAAPARSEGRIANGQTENNNVARSNASLHHQRGCHRQQSGHSVATAQPASPLTASRACPACVSR